MPFFRISFLWKECKCCILVLLCRKNFSSLVQCMFFVVSFACASWVASEHFILRSHHLVDINMAGIFPGYNPTSPISFCSTKPRSAVWSAAAETLLIHHVHFEHCCPLDRIYPSELLTCSTRPAGPSSTAKISHFPPKKTYFAYYAQFPSKLMFLLPWPSCLSLPLPLLPYSPGPTPYLWKFEARNWSLLLSSTLSAIMTPKVN